MKADHTEAGAKLLVQRIGELDAEVRKLRDERDRWRTVAEGLYRAFDCLDTTTQQCEALAAFEQAKVDLP